MCVCVRGNVEHILGGLFVCTHLHLLQVALEPRTGDPGNPVWVHSTDPQTLVCPAPSTPAPAPEQPLGGSVSLDTWQGSTPAVGAAERDAPWGPSSSWGPTALLKVIAAGSQLVHRLTCTDTPAQGSTWPQMHMGAQGHTCLGEHMVTQAQENTWSHWQWCPSVLSPAASPDPEPKRTER